MTATSGQDRGLLFAAPGAAEAPAAAAGPPTPDRVMQFAHGYIASKFLFIGVDVDLFDKLGTGGVTLEGVAGACGLPARTTRILLSALVMFGLVERDGDHFRNATDTEAFLTDRGPLDVRPLLRYFHRVSYPSWLEATRAIRTGEGVRKELDAVETELYESGVAVTTAPGAAALPGVYDFSRHQKLMDVGGGVGMYLSAALAANPGLAGTLLELPEVVEQARGQVAVGPAGDRIELVAADMFTDPLPPGHDAMLLSNIIHLFPPEPNVALLRRLREAAPDGGRLLLLDWWLDPDAPHPNSVFGAGEFLMISGGCTYTVEEMDAWLKETGWRLLDNLPMIPPMTLLVAETA